MRVNRLVGRFLRRSRRGPWVCLSLKISRDDIVRISHLVRVSCTRKPSPKSGIAVLATPADRHAATRTDNGTVAFSAKVTDRVLLGTARPMWLPTKTVVSFVSRTSRRFTDGDIHPMMMRRSLSGDVSRGY